MNLADVFTFLFLTLGFLVVLIAYWLGTSSLFPGLTLHCADRFQKRPVFATLIGFFVGIPALIFGTLLSSKSGNGGLKLAGILIAILPLLLALAGSSGLALLTGLGMQSSADDAAPWRRLLRGGSVLALTFVLPIVGTLLLAWALTAGCGAFLLSWRSRNTPLTPQTQPNPAPKDL